MLWIFGKLSDQDTIHEIRDRIRGNLLGIRIFGDEIGTLFRLQEGCSRTRRFTSVTRSLRCS